MHSAFHHEDFIAQGMAGLSDLRPLGVQPAGLRGPGGAGGLPSQQLVQWLVFVAKAWEENEHPLLIVVNSG